MEATEITYTGPPAMAGLLVSYLEDEGARVEWERPDERRDMPGAAEQVAVLLVVYGGKAAIRAAVAKFRERWPRADVDWREEDGYR